MTTVAQHSSAAPESPLSCSTATSLQASPATRLWAAGARANPEEKPLPGSTSLNLDYRSPGRSPSTKSLTASPGSPTRRDPGGTVKDVDRSARSTWTNPAPRQPFMPTPRRGTAKPSPYPALAQIQETSLAPPLYDLSVGQTAMSFDSRRYGQSPAKPLAASLVANAEPKYTLASDSFSPAKKALRASINPASTRTRDPTAENLPQRVLRSAARGTSTAPSTPSAAASLRFSNADTSFAAQSSHDLDLTGGRASPVRQEAVVKPRAKVTEGIGSRFKSPKKANNQALSSTSPEKRGLGISMGLVAPPSPLKQAKHGAAGSRSFDLEEELEDSSFVYADPEDPDADIVGMSSGAGETGMADRQESVMVHVRLRPPKAGEKCAWIPNTLSGFLSLEASLASQRVQQGAAGPFAFDGLLTGSANRPVYVSVARPLVRSALDGYDAVVFAYGQTASGKTFTLSGDERGEEQGIIPRAVRDIFRGIRQSSARREYLLRASYLEIWNENVKDLLEPSNVPQVRDDRRKGGRGTFVHPLREEIVTSPGQVRELLARGQANRHVGATDWNERSSRSHTCFKMTIESWERDPDSAVGIDGFDDDDSTYPASADTSSRLGKKVRVSELCLIDLAGSEKYVSQGSDRRAEGAHINKSLLTLGKVIFALSEKSAKGANNVPAHVPYRDSKLTRILQNSLSGNARVAVVCTINPNPSAVDESLSTLNFAKRVKKVCLHAKRNEVEGDGSGLGGAEAQALIMRYRDEAIALRKRVAELQSGAATPRIDDDRLRQLQDRLDVIGSLVVRGGGAADRHAGGDGDENGNNHDYDDDDSDDDDVPSPHLEGSERPARPVSPSRKQRGFEFSDPPHILQEKLYHANTKIAGLQKKLSSRPSLPAACRTEADKDALIGRLQQQIRELEMVCEAQAADAPPKIREDVEREWSGKVEALEGRLREKEQFVSELSKECERLRRANQQLIRLAHSQTASMVAQLHSLPPKPVVGLGLHGPAHHGRPVSVLGGSEMEAWREAFARSQAAASSSSPFSFAGSNADRSPQPVDGTKRTDSRCAVPAEQSYKQQQQQQQQLLRAPNRFRPRRSVSHDAGLIKMGMSQLELGLKDI